MTQQPLAYLYPEFLESNDARPIRILSEYLEPLRRFKEQKIQDTVVFFGSARVDSRERAERALRTLRARGVSNADAHYEAGAEQEPQGARVGALLRGSARARAAARVLEPDDSVRQSSVRRHVGRRPGHHGSCQPRRARRRRQDGRAEHPAAVRAGRQPVHHRRAALRVSLLLHAQVLVRVSCEGAGDFSRAASARATSCSRSSRSCRPTSSRRRSR